MYRHGYLLRLAHAGTSSNITHSSQVSRGLAAADAQHVGESSKMNRGRQLAFEELRYPPASRNANSACKTGSRPRESRDILCCPPFQNRAPQPDGKCFRSRPLVPLVTSAPVLRMRYTLLSFGTHFQVEVGYRPKRTDFLEDRAPTAVLLVTAEFPHRNRNREHKHATRPI
jgi:hypothetical protein